jgi:uncharacterized protein
MRRTLVIASGWLVVTTEPTTSDTQEQHTRDRHTTLQVTVWAAYAVAALLLLGIGELTLWAGIVLAAAAVLAVVPRLRPAVSAAVDRRDLLMIAVLYVAVVALFRVAFTVFGTDNVLGLFLCFAAGLLLGTVGPIAYQVWGRGADLHSLGLGLHNIALTVGLGLALAGVQFTMTLWGYPLPAPVDWVPLLVMSIVVGLFEAVFFRGFIQGRLEASLGPVPAVAGAALLYAGYHVGYGMPLGEMWFLLGLGVVYAIVYRLTRNILILWPLLTPLGAFYNNLDAGDIALPWEAILGFADVAALIALAVWLAHRRLRRSQQPTTPSATKEAVQ